MHNHLITRAYLEILCFLISLLCICKARVYALFATLFDINVICIGLALKALRIGVTEMIRPLYGKGMLEALQKKWRPKAP